ncbi:Pentatricopeptide repeat-containing protein [Hibiscus syriacus]|uniref:Pentatricopeptide repeat-containing protein n=1 Tax=Hibiscus syriacus TaxID=106335 RepID=A0A6A3B8K5_HIBSY|nr:pentatricopeptide repeat-containing protein At5g11310, mitochondrial-like [Hibiscus syriacus]KAE8711249.1 Pentatricopeptide repeat-containing protein [Hibiscus syriacus]
MKTLFQQQRQLPLLNVLHLPKLFFSDQSWLSSKRNPPINSSSSSFINVRPQPISTPAFIITNLLRDPTITSSSSLHSALDKTEVDPDPDMLQAIFQHFDSSPRLLHDLFLWAEKKPGFESSATLFDSMVNVLGKARNFEDAWSLVLDRIGDDGREGSNLVSVNTFVILIRRYARSGMAQAAIRTFEFVTSLDQICSSDEKTNLFEIMLDSLCKEGHVRVASEYFTRKKETDLCWVPSIKVYNILLNGWFRSRKLKHAERLWSDMKKNGVPPSVVTYGTLIEGYCTMRRVERAVELVDEMKEAGMDPNSKVYNPIIDSLGEEGRLKEALGMMERFLLCESGPDISTYNSLVKGHCKAKDLAGASKVLKMMISRGCIPTTTTYNYFFRYFSKFRKIEEAMNLYTKIIQSGHTPDRLTYQLLLKLLCEEERLDLAVQVSKEMTVRGYDRDLASSTMLVHLLCKMHRFEDAFGEFEDMIRRGIVPQYLTFERMNNELKKRGMTQMARKLCDMMGSVHSSKKLPNTYVGDEDSSRARRTSIMRKAEAMSDMLKTCNDPRELVKHRTLSGNAVSRAGQLIEIIKKRAKETSMNG